MQFPIPNRWTGKTQFIAEIDCAEDALRSVKVGLAILSGADLSGADLTDADLSGAILRGAILSDSDGFDHKIKRLIASVERISDGREAHIFETKAGEIVGKWGCRIMTLANFAERVEGYDHADKRAETLNIIAFVRAEAERLGVGKAEAA